jgi:hypothetical protein
MSNIEFPFAFSEGLASPDLSATALASINDRPSLAKLIAAECNVDVNNSAYSIVIGVINKTLEIAGITAESVTFEGASNDDSN